MATRYIVGYTDEVTKPLAGHALTIAKVMEEELGSEPHSRKTLEGVMRLIADAQGFGKWLNIDLAWKDLLESEFLTSTQ